MAVTNNHQIIQNIENLQNIGNLQNLPILQNKQTPQNAIENIDNMPIMKNIENNVQNMENIENLLNTKNEENNIENVKNIEKNNNNNNVQNVEIMENLKNMENMKNIENNNQKKEEKNVYQFKISLKRIKPTIWRRIQVPEDYTFYELSDAILNAMGWAGSHLHDFKMKNPETGGQETIGEDPNMDDSCASLDEKETKIKDFFINNKSKALYTYDFGDNWDHEVQLMRILPAIDGKEYPVCIAGKRACPPEDCGGTWGYQSLLEKRGKPKDQLTDEEREELEWYQIDDDFDPEEFNPRNVDFGVFDFFSMLGMR